MENYIEMMTLCKIDIGCLVLKPKTVLFVYVDGDNVGIKSDGLEMIVSKRLLEGKTERPFHELFISKEDADSAMTYGDEIKLLTDRGLVTYSIEDISFEKKSIAYATLHLKIV